MTRSSSGDRQPSPPDDTPPTQRPGRPHPPRTSSARRVVRSGAHPTNAIRARIAPRGSGTTATYARQLDHGGPQQARRLCDLCLDGRTRPSEPVHDGKDGPPGMRTGMRGGMHSGDDPTHGSAARFPGLRRGTTLTHSFRAAAARAPARSRPASHPRQGVLRILNRARLANAEQLGVLVYRNRHYAQIRTPPAVGHGVPRAVRPPAALGHRRLAVRVPS
jgi:hypothetical protein